MGKDKVKLLFDFKVAIYENPGPDPDTDFSVVIIGRSGDAIGGFETYSGDSFATDLERWFRNHVGTALELLPPR